MLKTRIVLRFASRLQLQSAPCSNPRRNTYLNKNHFDIEKKLPSIAGQSRFYSSWISRETRKEYTLNLDEFKNALEEDKVYIVDVREPFEVADGKVPASNFVNIPIGQIFRALTMAPDDFEKKFGRPMPKKDDSIVIMCKAGIRSTWAFQVAQHFGFAKAKHFIGGWNEWENRDK